jgi:hypothetical protein
MNPKPISATPKTMEPIHPIVNVNPNMYAPANRAMIIESFFLHI